MSIESKLKELLTSYPSGAYYIETLSITHPNMTKEYYITTDSADVVATLENSVVATFKPSQIQVQLNDTQEHLDQNFSFTIGDLENILDDELSRISLDSPDPILVTYRSFISNDLSEPAEVFKLEVFDISQRVGYFTIECGVSQMNWFSTGQQYSFDRFPMLRAL